MRTSAIVAFALAVAGSAAVQAADSAVVVMYHRFGEGKYPSTNTRLDQFEAHIRELKSGPYAVLPLPEIVAALKAGRPLPDRAVGIAIDDAYLSIYTEAWPRLKAAGLPFTLFVETSSVDARQPDTMNWDQIRELKAAGVVIGSQTHTHPHMPRLTAEKNREEIAVSNARFKAELGETPTLFAYPYGEVSLEVIRVVREADFAAAFGQHSGVLGDVGDFFYLPRFPFNETYGDMTRFKTAVNALPLRVADVTPEETLVTNHNPPAMGFTVKEGQGDVARLRCYAPEKATLERLPGDRIEVRAAAPFPKGRTRLNCTMPAENGRWRWMGRQFYVP